MEVFTNQTKVIFTNAEAASKAKEIASQVIASVEPNYNYLNGIKNTIRNLSINDNALCLPEDEGQLLTCDLLEIMTDVVKAIAEQLPSENFTFDIFGEDTYTEGGLEGKYEDGTLVIRSIYYPDGYYRNLFCPECGEDIVALDDYIPGKKYICPECGEELDLSEEYKEIAPIITVTSLKIA